MRRTDWRTLSRCGDQNPEVFFADRGRPSQEAAVPCGGCPVRDQCLQVAVESPWQPYGVWGGRPAKEVRQLWRSQHPGHHRAEVEEAVGLRKDRSR